MKTSELTIDKQQQKIPKKTDLNYWNEHWRDNNIGFHRLNVNPYVFMTFPSIIYLIYSFSHKDILKNTSFQN